MPYYQVDEVVGIGSTQILLVRDITFAVPVYEVVEELFTVNITDCHVCTDKVIFNGTVEKNIVYKTPPGVTGEGTIAYHKEDFTFSGFVTVPGAKPGDKCQIEKAEVGDCRFLIPATSPPYTSARQKFIVDVAIKVIRTLEQPSI
ncbi:DUF3794 domain-containing protein [Ammonifex thiophilus]|uniref:DUF3794 domain-containing protein n=1 Tax=Ammonifex thiophilus TaxID=444093 RepID=A0A3D8P3R0_9THEO|nr:DUF3794 domain-containing protein [Ammonifex thiophilus]RDV83445.1 DUF3794 domain-containing protein [Ammonifex thiophilus]